MIRIENLHKSFGESPVLTGVNLEIPRGEIVALIGPSGEGKSVLLKHIVGLLRPNKGRVFIDGEEIGRLHGRNLEQIRSRIGFLFQGGALFNSLNLYENVAFPLKEKTRLTDKEIHDRVNTALDHVGLPDVGQKFPSQVSGGMLKRAALARSLVQSPEILLFDEPTTGLDPLTVNTIQNLILNLHKRLHFTGIIVTHEIPRIFGVVQKVAMLHRGAVRIFGTPEEIATSKDPIVASFIRGTNNIDYNQPLQWNGENHV